MREIGLWLLGSNDDRLRAAEGGSPIEDVDRNLVVSPHTGWEKLPNHHRPGNYCGVERLLIRKY